MTEPVFEGTEETLVLPGVTHLLKAHRDRGEVTLEAWSPFCGAERPAFCYLSPADRRALAAFLMKDLKEAA